MMQISFVICNLQSCSRKSSNHGFTLQLMDGRKSVGGKLEVKMKIRDPFTSKQVEETKEKWLVIDRFDRALPKVINFPSIRQ